MSREERPLARGFCPCPVCHKPVEEFIRLYVSADKSENERLQTELKQLKQKLKNERGLRKLVQQKLLEVSNERASERAAEERKRVVLEEDPPAHLDQLSPRQELSKREGRDSRRGSNAQPEEPLSEVVPSSSSESFPRLRAVLRDGTTKPNNHSNNHDPPSALLQSHFSRASDSTTPRLSPTSSSSSLSETSDEAISDAANDAGGLMVGFSSFVETGRTFLGLDPPCS